MRNIKLTISYDGTNYQGWQIQPNGPTVQEEIEKAIEKVFGRHHRLYGASRTDAGVHALAQSANFKTTSAMPPAKITCALNALLPEDIVIIGSEEVPHDFNSQFNAKSKIYRYHIYNASSRDPFHQRHYWRVPYRLNMALMKREALVLVGKHDFTSFKATDKKKRSSVRNIFRVDIKRKKGTIVIEIEGDGFLYNMVRNIAGTLIDIGRGYLPESSMKHILKSKDRTQAGPTAPAQGLFLVQVKY